MHAISRMGGEEFTRRKSAATSSSMETTSYVASQLVEDMSNAELVRNVDNETRTNRHLFLENDMFERYLCRAEPLALGNLEQMMQQAVQAEARQQRISKVASRVGSLSHVSSAVSMTSGKRPGPGSLRNSASYAVGTFERGMVSATPSFTRTMIPKEAPTINVSHKTDMVTREMEELRTSIEHLSKLYTSRKAHLKAENEEISTMLGEIQTTSNEFTDKVIIKGVEQLTKKIPARVFVRFMDEWFRKTDLLSGQLRLKTNTYRTLYKKLSLQLEEKIELGETLNPVDFEFQEIQKLEVSKQLRGKNFDLTLLKKETAHTHREFTAFKDRLAEQLAELQKLKSKTSEKERLVATMEVETEIVQKDIDAAETDLAKIQRFRRLYTVPDVQEYARVRDEARRVKRELRNWNRRTSLQHKELISTRQQFRRVKEALEAL